MFESTGNEVDPNLTEVFAKVKINWEEVFDIEEYYAEVPLTEKELNPWPKIDYSKFSKHK